jgi:hypothetical protein
MSVVLVLEARKKSAEEAVSEEAVSCQPEKMMLMASG